MGFGFNLFFVFILLPLTGILIIAWLISKKILFGKAIGLIWIGILGLIILTGIGRWLTSKTELTKEDYYGEYIINREFFNGIQSDWQYNHFRFEITDQDSILFHVTDHETVLKTYRGTVRTTDPKNHRSERLVIQMEQPTHHILYSNPTTYRSTWSFYLVFYSPIYKNVFFKKGKWVPIE